MEAAPYLFLGPSQLLEALGPDVPPSFGVGRDGVWGLPAVRHHTVSTDCVRQLLAKESDRDLSDGECVCCVEALLGIGGSVGGSAVEGHV